MKFSFPHHIYIMPERDFTKEFKRKFLKPTWNYKVPGFSTEFENFYQFSENGFQKFYERDWRKIWNPYLKFQSSTQDSLDLRSTDAVCRRIGWDLRPSLIKRKNYYFWVFTNRRI